MTSKFVPPVVVGAAMLALAMGAQAQEPEPPRASATSDTTLRITLLPLGLPGADSAHDRGGLLGRVDAKRAPLLASGSALDALAGRLPGVTVHRPWVSPGRARLVALGGRAPGDRLAAPLHVLDGVPLVAPPDMLGSSDIETIDVLSGQAASRSFGSLARDGMIHMRGGFAPPGEGLVVRARVHAGSSIAPPSPGIARHHDYLVDLAGQYVDEAGNVVSREDRVRVPWSVMATPYIVPLHDPLRAVLRTGSHRSAWVAAGQRVGSSELAFSAARDRSEGAVLETDPFVGTHLRAAARHEFGRAARVALVAHRAWTDDEYLPSQDFLRAAGFYPADIDLRARDASGAYILRPAPEVFPANPLYSLAVDRPLNGRRSVLGAQGGWAPLRWLELHGGAGYDVIGRKTSYGEVLLGSDGTPTGNSRFSSAAERASLRTIAAAVTANRRFGPVGARFTLSVTDAVERDSVAQREEIRPTTCTDPEACPTSFVGTAQWRKSARRVYGAHADGRWGDMLELSFSGRREENEHFPVWDRWRTHYRGVAAVHVAKAGWWDWPALDEMTLSLGHGTASGFLTREDLRNTVFSFGGNPLEAEHETSTDAALYARAFQRVDLRLRHEWASVRNAPLREYIFNPPSANGWQSFSTIDRRGIELDLRAELARGPSWEWSMSLAIHRLRSRFADDPFMCSRMGVERHCPGARLGTMYGFDWLRDPGQLPAVHAGSADAFAINDDGLLVAVGTGGSPDVPRFGTTVTIDGVEYEWGMPIPLRDETGEVMVPIGTAGNDIGLGWATQLRWRSLVLGGTIAGRLGGDVYDQGMFLRYGSRTHPDLDQAGKPAERQKPYEYYSRLRSSGAGSSWFVRDASHLALEEVYARLLIPAVGRFGDLELAVLGRHLAVWSRRDAFEPVLPLPGLATDDLWVPRARTVSIRVGITF